MNTGNISWEQRRPVHRADNIITTFANFLEIWLPQHPGILRACPHQYMNFLSLPSLVQKTYFLKVMYYVG